MGILYTIFFALLLSVTVGARSAEDAVSSPPQIGDVRNCPTTSPIFPQDPLYRMEVLPGAGFDALRSVDMGQVHAYNYSQCRVSNDGRYLLPDNVFLVPTLESQVQVFSELIDDWDQYTSTVSSSISLSASFQSIISGKFSSEYESVKSHMYHDNSVTTRVQLRNALYKVKLQPDSELHPVFKARLFEIAANIQSNNTDYARYLAELMVRQYGTHYVTSMDAGAVLSQVDHVKSSFVGSSESNRIAVTASASVNFLQKFSVSAGFSFSVTGNETQQFVDNRTYSRVYSWGGPPYSINMTVTEWEKGIPNGLVAIDRTGDPLYYAITPATLPEMPESTVYQLANFVSRAISRYYSVNTRRGCTTNVNSQNFDFQANVDDHSCEAPQTNYTFGGVYQTCTYTRQNYIDLCNSGPAPVLQNNPLTGNASCPDSYKPVLLSSGQYKHTVHKAECQKHCTLHFFNCRSDCYKKPITSVVNYETYWCVNLNQAKLNTGYLFGGYYTSTVANPFSGTQACPRYYMPLQLGVDAYICVSNDYELGSQASVPFAGFMSCEAGNPLAATKPSMDKPSSWPHACPAGFSQHLLDLDGDCEINYCVKTGSFNKQQLLPPRLPPFRKRKQMNPNTTSTLVIIGNHGVVWYKNEDGDWVKDYDGTQNGKSYLDGFNDDPDSSDPSTSSSSSSSSLSRGSVAGISISVTIALCTVIAFFVLTGYSIKKRIDKRRKTGGDGACYLSITEGNTPSPGNNDAV